MRKLIQISNKNGTTKFIEYFNERSLERSKDFEIRLGFNPRLLTYDHYIIEFENEEDLLAFRLTFDGDLYEDQY